MICANIDLPLPLGPTMPVNCLENVALSPENSGLPSGRRKVRFLRIKVALSLLISIFSRTQDDPAQDQRTHAQRGQQQVAPDADYPAQQRRDGCGAGSQ